MNNFAAIKETAASAEEIARNIWLAGIGAYGMGYDEVKTRFDSLSTESNKLFTDLIAKGEKIEADGKVKVNEAKAKVDVEARVSSVRSTLGLDKTDADQKIEELSAKIDALTDAVAKLAADAK